MTEALGAIRRKAAGSYLPERYSEPWLDAFINRALRHLEPGMSVLDIGPGRRPALEPQRRPINVHYAGLDISEAELVLAPSGSYDEIIVGDIADLVPGLAGRFDLVVSWQVLEHVKSLDAAFANIHSYLKPGGWFVGQFSGAFSLFGLVNRLVPQTLGVLAMQKLLGRHPDTIFPAYYHHCWHGKVCELLADWKVVEVLPRYRGASYLRFAPALQRAYLLFEDWAESGKHANLATHYLVDARAG
jgi:SAM-dependent methyltransferase